jgi:hypothetical protein
LCSAVEDEFQMMQRGALIWSVGLVGAGAN